MNRVLGLGLVIACCLSGTTIDIGTFTIDPKSSILLANRNPAHPDHPDAPVFINLDHLAQTYGLGNSLAGYALELRAIGNMCYISLESGLCPSIPTEGFLGAFDLDDVVNLDSINPLAGAIASRSRTTGVYPDTFYDHLPTTGGPPDFLIFNSISVVVPEGAHFMAVGLYDSYYADNSGTILLNVRVEIPDEEIPEPSTALLTLTGMCLAAVGIRRRRVAARRDS